MTEALIGGGIFLLFGSVLVITSIWDMTYEKRFLSGNVSVTPGKITEICDHSSTAGDGSQSVNYTASVAYQVNGEMFRVSGTDKRLKKYLYVNEKQYHVGDVVEIAYDNDNPFHCIIKGNRSRNSAVFLLLFGVVFVLLSIVGFAVF